MDIQYPPKVLEACMYVGFSTKQNAQCLKAMEKVAFNIASEANYVYILCEQKFTKNAKNGQFGDFFENLKHVVKQCYQIGHS